MVPRLSLLGWVLCLWGAGLAAAPAVPALTLKSPELVRLQAVDGMLLKADWHHSATPTASLVLVLPGFIQHKGTGNMRFVAALLSPTVDVMVLDFRGTGASNGLFNFGADEAADVQAALAWAQPRYRDLSLLGFSLGAYTALRAASQGPLHPQRCLLVSVPDNVDGILGSGGVFTFLFKGWGHHDKLAQPEEGDLFFRWGSLLVPKPTAQFLAQGTVLPLHFLVGLKDELAYPRISRQVFDAASGPATWTSWGDGRHAEHMALLDPQGFKAWVDDCRGWRGTQKMLAPFHQEKRHDP